MTCKCCGEKYCAMGALRRLRGAYGGELTHNEIIWNLVTGIVEAARMALGYTSVFDGRQSHSPRGDA